MPEPPYDLFFSITDHPFIVTAVNGPMLIAFYHKDVVKAVEGISQAIYGARLFDSTQVEIHFYHEDHWIRIHSQPVLPQETEPITNGAGE